MTGNNPILAFGSQGRESMVEVAGFEPGSDIHARVPADSGLRRSVSPPWCARDCGRGGAARARHWRSAGASKSHHSARAMSTPVIKAIAAAIKPRRFGFSPPLTHKPHAGGIKHPRFAAYPWNTPEGRATGSAIVGRSSARPAAVRAARFRVSGISTPTTETRNRSSLRKIRTGSLVSELLNLPPPVVGAPACLHNHQVR